MKRSIIWSFIRHMHLRKYDSSYDFKISAYSPSPTDNLTLQVARENLTSTGLIILDTYFKTLFDNKNNR